MDHTDFITFYRFCLMSVFITHILFFQPCIITAQNHLSTVSKVVMYDASKGTNPDEQGWIYLSNPLTQSTVHRITEHGQHFLNTLSDRTETAGYFGNIPQPILLERHTGFTFHISLQLLEESHISDNRAGFSVIILSNDACGLELAFWEDEIWVYNEQFERAERFSVNTTDRIRQYSVEISGDEYKLFIDENFAFNGPVRDYSDFPMPAEFPNVYGTPNLLFFGNNTSRAAAKTAISRVAVQTPASGSARLYQNAPNPFQHTTSIPFYLETSGHVRLEVFDLTGRHVASILDEYMHAGNHQVEFNAIGLSSGLYLYRLETSEVIKTKTFLLVK